MPTPAPIDSNSAGTPATDKPAAPAAAAGATAKIAATAVTADTISVSGKKTYIVAPGRSLSHGHPAPDESPPGTVGKVDHLSGHKADPSKGLVLDPLKGDTVELDEADAKRLIDLGFLLAPDGSRVIPVDGPATDVENGVSITQGADA